MATASKAKAAAPSNGAAANAAQEEGSDQEHIIEWMGLEIVLPPKLRESVIWRFGILRDNDFQGQARLIESVIGAEQFAKVLDHLDEEDVYADPENEDSKSPMAELIDDALGAYGLITGESGASTDS
jgi:hypothetical protein